MSLLVDNPIPNSPFEDPTRYWAYREDRQAEKGQMTWMAGGQVRGGLAQKEGPQYHLLRRGHHKQLRAIAL